MTNDAADTIPNVQIRASVAGGDVDQADMEPADGAVSKSWLEHPRTVARLQILVVALGVLLFAAFVTVIGRIAYMAHYQPKPAQTAPTPAPDAAALDRRPEPGASLVDTVANSAEQVIELPAGAVVEDVQPMATGSLMIRYRDDGGTVIIVLDPATGTIKQRMRLRPQTR